MPFSYEMKPFIKVLLFYLLDIWCELGKKVRSKSGKGYVAMCEEEYGKLVGGSSSLEFQGSVSEEDAIAFRMCCNPCKTVTN